MVESQTDESERLRNQVNNLEKKLVLFLSGAGEIRFTELDKRITEIEEKLGKLIRCHHILGHKSFVMQKLYKNLSKS
jgi:hypothetical protein